MIPLKPASEASWRRCARLFLIACFGTVGLVLLSVIVIDPYDGGRFPTFMPPGTSTDLPSTLNVSRGRDPRFDAVTLGDSRAVLVDPQHLSEGSGFRFVQMAVEGASVSDQMVYLRWFARHHPAVRAIVLSTGLDWCGRGPEFPHSTDFPAALYAESAVDYLRATLNTTSVRIMGRRVLYALGRSPRIDPAHFVDIQKRYPWRFDGAPLTWSRSADPIRPVAQDLPAMRLLGELLSGLPAQPPIVLWMPPRYVSALPPPDSGEGRELGSCKASLRAWAEQRSHTAFLDFAVDNAFARDRDNFLDVNHLNRRLSALIEAEIATTVARMN